MTADSSGNDILAVGVPVTGKIAFAPFTTTLLTPSQGQQADISGLMGAYTPLGLLKEDGGIQFAWASNGDPIQFWQQGYTIANGDSDVTIAVTAGQILSPFLRRIISGASPDANGMTTIDGGGPDTQWVAYTEEIFKNGAIRRRQAPNVKLLSATEDKSARGDVLGNALVFTVNRDTTIGGHFREWVLPAVDTAAKTAWTLTISGSPTGGTYSLVVNGFSTAPIAYNATSTAIAAAINALAGVTGISGVTASGSGPFSITFPSNVSLAVIAALTGGSSPSAAVA